MAAKNLGTAYLLGIFGLHYAYLGNWTKQILLIITSGGLLIWWVKDLMRMKKLVDDTNIRDFSVKNSQNILNN